MSIQVHWQDKSSQIILCTIIGSWSLTEFDAAYREMIEFTRQTDDKVHIIFDLHQAYHPEARDYKGLIPVSPFIASAFLVFDKQSYESAELIAKLILKVFDIPLDEATTIEEAIAMIQQLQQA